MMVYSKKDGLFDSIYIPRSTSQRPEDVFPTKLVFFGVIMRARFPIYVKSGEPALILLMADSTKIIAFRAI